MEEKNHQLFLLDRQKASLNGISKVITFDLNEIFLVTEMGKLKIKGQELSITKFEKEKGELEFVGRVQSIEYIDPIRNKVKKWFCA